jgi:hypothetical protein
VFKSCSYHPGSVLQCIAVPNAKIQNGSIYTPFVDIKSNAIPAQAWTGPEVSRRLRLPNCQLYAPATFTR